MRRTTTLLAVCAAAVLAVSGCSSSVEGTAQAGSSISTSTSAEETTSDSTADTTEESTEESTEEETSTQETDDGTTTSGLDSDSAYWFSTFCTQATDLAQYVSPDTSGQTIAEAQATVVEAYTNISISASTSVGVLQSLPAPTFEGGGEVQSSAIERFTAISDVYSRGALTILDLTPTSEADLKAAIDAVEAEAAASIPSDMVDIDPAIAAEARTLPECEGVFG